MFRLAKELVSAPTEVIIRHKATLTTGETLKDIMVQFDTGRDILSRMDAVVAANAKIDKKKRVMSKCGPMSE